MAQNHRMVILKSTTDLYDKNQAFHPNDMFITDIYELGNQHAW